jgi:hypothetical protein
MKQFQSDQDILGYKESVLEQASVFRFDRYRKLRDFIKIFLKEIFKGANIKGELLWNNLKRVGYNEEFIIF